MRTILYVNWIILIWRLCGIQCATILLSHWLSWVSLLEQRLDLKAFELWWSCFGNQFVSRPLLLILGETYSRDWLYLQFINYVFILSIIVSVLMLSLSLLRVRYNRLLHLKFGRSTLLTVPWLIQWLISSYIWALLLDW